MESRVKYYFPEEDGNYSEITNVFWKVCGHVLPNGGMCATRVGECKEHVFENETEKVQTLMETIGRLERELRKRDMLLKKYKNLHTVAQLKILSLEMAGSG